MQREADVGREDAAVCAEHAPLLAHPADISFTLHHHPPGGGFCPRCGGSLVIEPVSVITPPDGGVIGAPVTRCEACAEH